uniref:Cytochrome P450 CYP82T1 n=1 Tax=Bupleurum chinense TaxID=52451 RepID=I3VI20_BUPCH|nr:cytochrome P450 CYP82T1 [Bupleurum chinense]
MDALGLLQLIAGFVALVSFYTLWSSRTKNHDEKKKTQAPKPNGAWPIIGHIPLLASTKPACKILGDMADKYGPVFRIQLGWQNAVVVSSKEAVMQIFTTNDNNFMTRPTSLTLKYMGYNGAFFAFAPYSTLYREMRKASIFEVLSNSRMELLKPLRASEMTTCIKELYSLCCKNGIVVPVKLNIEKWVQQVIINLMLQMLARKRYSSIGEGETQVESRRFKKAFEEFFILAGAFELSDVIPFIEWMDLQGNRRAMIRTAKELDVFMSSWIDEHKKSREQDQLKEDRDFIDVMISLFPEPHASVHGYKSTDVIKATVMSVIMGGSDAPAITLTWALSLLLNNNNVLEKAQQELDDHIGKDRWVEESDIRHLVYLQAILKETLRLYPGGPLGIPRKAKEDCTVAGYHVPKGTQLWVNIWKLHRDSETWTAPYEFQPERFLTSHAGVDVRGQQFEYIPYSSGRRSCPGITASMQMMQLTLARLLQGFNLVSPTNEPVDMTEAAGISMHRKYPFEVVLTPRLPCKLYQMN